MRWTLNIILLSILIVNLVFIPVSACTIFSVSDGTTSFAGSNEDWSHSNFSVRFYTPLGSRNGYMAFTDTDDPYDLRVGMNEYGVFIDSTWVPPSNVTIDPNKPFLNHNMFKHILESCETVNESIDVFSQHNIAETWDWQLLIADAAGDSVVIVAGPNETLFFIRRNSTFQLITNGNIALPELGQSTSSERRYAAAQTLLDQVQENMTINYLRDVLDAAHSDWTAFSTVFDLVDQDVHMFYNHDFSNKIVFNLDAELTKGNHRYALSDLFTSDSTSLFTNDSVTMPNRFDELMISGIVIGLGIAVAVLVLVKVRK